MNIILLTSVYPARDVSTGTTQVAHYFAKEWAAAGHKVHVIHTESAFPRFYYFFGKLMKKILDSRLGHLVPDRMPAEYEETKDGVKVSHILLKKSKPHGRFPQKQLQQAFQRICSYIEKEGVPDWFVGHWDNPQLELLHYLKEKYHRKTCLVYHNNKFEALENCYGADFELLRNDIDLVGFRNLASKKAYARRFGTPGRSFIASSGISGSFIEAGRNFERDIDTIRNFIFVGAIVARKFPLTNIAALARSYKQEPFNITFIGDGLQKDAVKDRFQELNCSGNIRVTGRIPRDEVIPYLKESDVFIMISRKELFGLVYLEAMAFGCITIGSRGEGIDGIIVDGVNGFLCEAGNEDELCSIINRIRTMPKQALMDISRNAKSTAMSYSDSEVAERYIEELKTISA